MSARSVAPFRHLFEFQIKIPLGLKVPLKALLLGSTTAHFASRMGNLIKLDCVETSGVSDLAHGRKVIIQGCARSCTLGWVKCCFQPHCTGCETSTTLCPIIKVSFASNLVLTPQQ